MTARNLGGYLSIAMGGTWQGIVLSDLFLIDICSVQMKKRGQKGKARFVNMFTGRACDAHLDIFRVSSTVGARWLSKLAESLNDYASRAKPQAIKMF